MSSAFHSRPGGWVCGRLQSPAQGQGIRLQPTGLLLDLMIMDPATAILMTSWASVHVQAVLLALVRWRQKLV